MRGEIKSDRLSVSPAISFYSPVYASIQKRPELLEQGRACLDTELGATEVVSQLASIVKMRSSKHHVLSRAVTLFLRHVLFFFSEQ